MKPILIDFGFLKIHSYGLFVATGILVAFLISLREAVKRGIDEDNFYTLGIIILFAAILGARVSYVISEIDYFSQNPLKVFYIWEGGLTSFGGIFGGVLAGTFYVFLKKMSWFEVADSIALGLPVGFAIGRLGCFFNGCCYGIACESPVSVVFPALNDGLPRLPTQLFESAYSLLIFGIIYWLNRRYTGKGLLFFSFSFLYGLFRFFNEMIRVNPKVFLGLSGSQVSSVLMMIAGAVYFSLSYRKIRRRDEG